MNYEIQELRTNSECIIVQPKTLFAIIIIHNWLIPDELASCMAPGF